MPDDWEILNGLNPEDASDASTYTLDEKGWYTNLEVYANSIVEHIMKGGNKDALSAVDEYYPSVKTTELGDISIEGDVERIEYYDLNGIRLDSPVHGINIRRIIYTSGKVVVDKVVKR